MRQDCLFTRDGHFLLNLCHITLGIQSYLANTARTWSPMLSEQLQHFTPEKLCNHSACRQCLIRQETTFIETMMIADKGSF